MANPIHILGYDHIVLRIVDKDAMLAFYCGVLGINIDRDRPELGLTHLRLGAQMIDLVTLGGPLGGAVPSTTPPSAPTWPPMASRLSRKANATAPTARDSRSTSAIPRAM